MMYGVWWRTLLRQENVIQTNKQKTLYNSVILNVLSLHILSCTGTGKYLKHPEECMKESSV